MPTVDNLYLQVAAANVPRTSHSALWVPSGEYVRTLLLEGAGTNLVTFPQTFSNGAWTKRNATIGSNAVSGPMRDSLGDIVMADTFIDDITNSGHDMYQFVDVLATIEASYTFHAKSGTGIFPVSTIYTAGGTLAAVFDTDNGVVTQFAATGTAEFIIDPWMEEYADGWFRCFIWGKVPNATPLWLISAAPAASGNDLGATGEVAYAGTGKNFQIFGANAQLGCPTSYMSGATRGVESATIPINFGPRKLSAYVRGIELGGMTKVGGGIITIGSLTYSSELVAIFCGLTLYYGHHLGAGAESRVSGVFPGPVFGDALEFRLLIDEDGSVTLGQSINEEAEILGVTSAALEFDVDWNSRFIRLNKATADGVFAYYGPIIIARDWQSLAWFREKANE